MLTKGNKETKFAYKHIDITRCSIEELKREIRALKDRVPAEGTQDTRALQDFALEANKRLKDEIKELRSLAEVLAMEVLGIHEDDRPPSIL